MKYNVEIVHIESGEIVRTITCSGERDAERVERGVLINNNHDSYFTRVVPASQEPQQ